MRLSKELQEQYDELEVVCQNQEGFADRARELEEQVKKPLSQFTRLELLAEIDYRMENE